MRSRESNGLNEKTTVGLLADLGADVKAGTGAARVQGSAPFLGQADTRRLRFPGPELGKYSIEAELGRGGMGVVYRAFDPRLYRHVALKLMLQRATAADLGRFRDEARVTAQLQHPSIVPIYDIGQTDSGEIYYTMRLVRGQTLAQLVDEHRAEVAGRDPQAPEGWTQFKFL